MKVGAEPKKVAILAILLAVAAYLMYTNIIASPAGAPPPSAVPRQASADPERAGAPPAAAAAEAPRLRRTSGGSQEWVPSLKPKRPEDRPDPMTVDPSLRLDLLAKLENVELAGGERSLFEFSQPPAPKAPEPKIVPKTVAATADNGEKPSEEKAEPKEAAKPPPPPIPLKFYGFVTGGGARRAFFLNGEEILVATEGQTLQSRYRVVRIGLSSAVVEDTQHKHQQTLPIEEAPQT